jgi:hypothetical protein
MRGSARFCLAFALACGGLALFASSAWAPRWIAGEGRPPAVGVEQLCRNGIVVQVAMWPLGSADPLAPNAALRDVHVIHDGGSLTKPRDLQIGWDPIWITEPLNIDFRPPILTHRDWFSFTYRRLPAAPVTGMWLSVRHPGAQYGFWVPLLPRDPSPPEPDPTDCMLVDVTPKSRVNQVKPHRSGEHLNVALLSSPGFRATEVAVSSVTAGSGALSDKPRKSWTRDINDDDRRDLVLQFLASRVVECQQTLLTLHAKMPGGQDIHGTDEIQTVDC